MAPQVPRKATAAGLPASDGQARVLQAEMLRNSEWVGDEFR